MSHIRDIKVLSQASKTESLMRASECVCDMFVGELSNKLKTIKVHAFIIYITNDNEDHLNYSHTGGFLSLYYFLEKGIAANTTDFEKKKIILDIIYNSLAYLASRENWNADLVLDTYNTCLNKGINNEWWYRGKIVAAPNRKHYVGVYNIYDIRRFESYLVLFDQDKKELIRHLIYRDKFDGFVINKVSWRNDKSFFITFSTRQKKFVYSINDLLNSSVTIIPSKLLLASN
jgi:hypothetical protein